MAKRIKTGRRVTYEQRKYTSKELKQLKKQHMFEAERWHPYPYYTVTVFLNPGDPGYEESIVEETYIEYNSY